MENSATNGFVQTMQEKKACVSWHFLQGQEVASWEGSSLDGAPSALVRLIPTPEECFFDDNEMECSPSSPFGTTYVHSMGNSGEVQLMLSAVVSHARIFHQPARAKGWPANVQDFGSRCSELLERFGLHLSLPKTHRFCVPVDSAPSSKDLPIWGMTCDGACWELGTLARIIGENGCGLLPTPRANKWGLEDSHGNTKQWEKFAEWLQNLPTPMTSEKHRGVCLGEMKRRTPMLKAQLLQAMRDGVLPTPTAHLYGSNKGGAAGRKGKKRPSLESRIGGIFLALREWMMGVPIGWTSKKPLSKWRWKEWQKSHGIEMREYK